MKTMRRRGRSFQTGQAIVLIALMMIVLLGFLALAIDGARYYQTRRLNQNAADSAALAAIYYFTQQSSPSTSGTWSAITASITSNGILSANGITDATTTLPNGQKPVQAWWLDSSGNFLNEFTPGTTGYSGSIPLNAHAIKVTTHIRYRTFFASVIGQLYLPTEATAIARETMLAKVPIDFPYSLYIAGTTCNVSVDPNNWAAAVFNSQNLNFYGDVWINGTLAWDYNITGADMKGHNWKIDGKVMIHGNNNGTDDVTAWAGNTQWNTNGVTAGDNSNPNIMSSGWSNFGPWLAPNNSQLGSWPVVQQPYATQWPSWLYENHYDPTLPSNPLTATDFEKPDGVLYKAYVKFGWKDYNGNTNAYQYGYTADEWFHTVSLTNQSLNDPDLNWHDFQTAYISATKKNGIYFVDGDIKLESGMPSSSHVTIVSTGRVFVPSQGNFTWSDAGFTAAGISIMAGGNPPAAANNGTNTDPNAGATHSPCAQSPYDWVMLFNGSNAQVTGYVYVPNGQVEFLGGFSSGNGKVAAGILAYSWRNGTFDTLSSDDKFGPYDNHPTQNAQYGNKPQPIALPVTGLVNESP